MSRVPVVGVFRSAVFLVAACAWRAAVPAFAQAAPPAAPQAAAAPAPRQTVTIPAVQLNQLLRGELVDVFEQALITQWPLDTLLKEQQAKPADLRVPVQIAAYYSLQNDTAKTIEYLSLPSTMQPDNPETCCLVASYLFGVVAQTARQEERLSPENMAKGMFQVERTLRVKPDYLPALLYETMLLVVQANLEKDPAKQAALRQEAEAVRARFSTLAKAAGTATPPEGSIPVAGPSFPTSPNAVRVGGNIRYPARLVTVEPAYPDAARQAGVQGVVILEALLKENGKVQDVRLLRSIPMLDEAAIAAVRQWEFAPTIVSGVPVRVIMTVTVSFPPKPPTDN
jgi:TonB family protein